MLITGAGNRNVTCSFKGVNMEYKSIQEAATIISEQLSKDKTDCNLAVAPYCIFPESIKKKLVIEYYVSMFDRDDEPVEPPEDFYVVLNCGLLSSGLFETEAFFTVNTTKASVFVHNVVIDNLIFKSYNISSDDDIVIERADRMATIEAIAYWINNHFKDYHKAFINYQLDNPFSIDNLSDAFLHYTNLQRRAVRFKYHDADVINKDAENYAYDKSKVEQKFIFVDYARAREYYKELSVKKIQMFVYLFNLLNGFVLPRVSLDNRMEVRNSFRNIIDGTFDGLERLYERTRICTYILYECYPFSGDEDNRPMGVVCVEQKDKAVTIRTIVLNDALYGNYEYEYIIRHVIGKYHPDELYLNISSGDDYIDNKYVTDHFTPDKMIFSQKIRDIKNVNDSSSANKEEPKSDDKPSLQSREG